MKNMKAMKKINDFKAVIPDPDPESRSSRKKRMMASLTCNEQVALNYKIVERLKYLDAMHTHSRQAYIFTTRFARGTEDTEKANRGNCDVYI